MTALRGCRRATSRLPNTSLGGPTFARSARRETLYIYQASRRSPLRIPNRLVDQAVHLQFVAADLHQRLARPVGLSMASVNLVPLS